MLNAFREWQLSGFRPGTYTFEVLIMEVGELEVTVAELSPFAAVGHIWSDLYKLQRGTFDTWTCKGSLYLDFYENQERFMMMANLEFIEPSTSREK